MVRIMSFLRSAMGENLRQFLWNLILIITGSCICALAINGILIPRKFVSSGVTGISLIFHYLIPFLPVSVFYLLFNVPLFALGWKYVSRRFFIYSLIGTAVFSAAVEWIVVPIHVQDPLLCSLLAGIIMGTGLGIILRSAGSSGGTDIISVMVQTRFSIRLGYTVLAFNSIVLAASAMLFSLDIALYTLIYMYVSSHILDLVVTGPSQRKSVMIISRSQGDIIIKILKELNRGVTVIKGQGGYSGEPEDIIYTVIAFRDLASMKKLINKIDPHAFVVFSDTAEVMGYRIGNQPHW
ncbi:MAG TPA: YitT family protein [Smithella sp.]|nr:YitT family protein [Smithella sp.]